jgi:hypothetical protein
MEGAGPDLPADPEGVRAMLERERVVFDADGRANKGPALHDQ